MSNNHNIIINNYYIIVFLILDNINKNYIYLIVEIYINKIYIK